MAKEFSENIDARMRDRLFIINRSAVAKFACGFFAIFCGTLNAQTADQLFINGNIYTVSDKQPHAEAIAVNGDRISFVGSNADAQKLRGENTRVIDLAGKTVVPGFTDSHCHIFGIGERELTLNLEGTNTLVDFLAKVSERVRKSEPNQWITGRGWIETFWKPSHFPTRQDLDGIAKANPVFLTRADGHAAVANTLALQAAGVTRDTPDPFGGKILKDKNGDPTGMLLDNAQDLVESKIPPPSDAQREQALLTGIDREIKLGWCEIQNAGSTLADQAIIGRAFEANKIKLRIYNAAYGPGEAAKQLLEIGPTINGYSHRFTQRTIKVIFDGALGSRGAALLAPYSDKRDTSGYLTQKPEELRPMFEEALRRGLQVETHAIGDRANRTILDLYEQAFRAVPAEQRQCAAMATTRGSQLEASQTERDRFNRSSPTAGQNQPLDECRNPRWRVEHAQILTQEDIPRFAKLGVIASMQPSHAISDLFFAPARLGKERLASAYAWNSLLKTGAIICAGSDAPVERGEPMIEFYAAVTRKSVRGEQKEGWHPEQAVTREQALKMLTINAAYAAFEENDKGTIEPGKLADFTILSADIMKIPPPQILKTTCAGTVIGGEVVYSAQ